MPRPKGSKNKVKTAIPTTDFAALIAEKAAAKESLTADITALEENLETIKADLLATSYYTHLGEKPDKTPSVFGFSDTEAAHHGRCV